MKLLGMGAQFGLGCNLPLTSIPGRAAALAKILIVDDDDSVRLTLQLVLQGTGHDVVAAGDGRRGLDLINAEAFDLLILDIFMPGMDGFETLRLVLQLRALLPIIER